jgi:hypothetical protein
MSKPKRTSIAVKGAAVTVLSQNRQDFISLTDIARYKDAERTDYLISNWLRNRNTIEFLGIWEQLNNPGFNPIEFDGIRKQAGLNSFILTAKRWIESTGAIGLVSTTGRYGGTYAHKDIVRQGLRAPERLLRLNEIAITQMRTLLADSGLKRLKE